MLAKPDGPRLVERLKERHLLAPRGTRSLPSYLRPEALGLSLALKHRLKSLAGSTLMASGAYRALAGKAGVIAAFHRIDDRYPGDSLCYRRQAFEAFCHYAKQHFVVISMTELLDRLLVGKSLAGTLVITFDDGYLDNYTVAAPILTELDLPATFFVTTGFLGSRHVAWWDAQKGIRSEWMHWHHVRELHDQGFDIGAHTVNHVNLREVRGKEARDEIKGSRKALEDFLGAPVDLFAYPYGGLDEVSEESRTLIKESGFRCCPSCFGGRVHPGDDPFRLRRVPISAWYTTPAQFALEILLD